MAIIIIGCSRYPLCNGVIEEADEIISTSHFLSDKENPLHPYSDRALHRRCFLKWDLRDAFISAYNEVMHDYHHMDAEGNVFTANAGDGR